MPKLTFAPVLGVLLALATAQAMASGFGRMNNATVLGQRLDFSVPLRLDAGQSIAADCVTAEVFAGEFRVAPSAVDVAVVPASDATERLIRIATRSAIDEPVVTVTLQIGCGNPMTRKFVAFIDPPTIELARAETPRSLAPVASASATLPRARTEVAIATPATPSASPAPAVESRPPATPRSAKPKPKRSAGAPAAAVARASSRTAAPKTTTLASGKGRKTSTSPRVAAAKPAKGPRLQLDTTPDVMLAQTNLRPADTLPPVLPAAASAPQDAASAAADAEIAAQRERLVAMETSLAKLRSESQATQASLVQLQAQLRESQSQRFANPLVYALMALCALLAAAVALLWRSRAAERRAVPQWWAPPTSAGIAAMAAETGDAAGEVARPAPGPVAVPPEQWEASDSIHGETTASPRLLDAVASAPPAAESEREMSVEELIDLEQQAEFFVVLGQDDAAIDLLMGHLRSSGGASPLPYLKLLEIYRRRDEREAYERTRDRFNRRFNAYAPDWDTDLQKGRALEDYGHVVGRLQSLWTSPGLAMRALETSLFRRDPGASNFDLPAYRELLFLYSIARDLSEHQPPANVDLLLPIDAEHSATGTLTQLHPTRPMPIAADAYTTQVDVDITCLDAGPKGDDERPSRYLSDFGTTSGDVHVPVERFAVSR
ncbi:MAG: hypothetical protein ABI633_07270 [Burkholderiales bacterium]